MAGHTKRRNNLAALEAAGGIEHVCNELVSGKSIKQIAEQFDMWPMQLMRWIDEDDNRRLNYAQARENQAEAFASEIIALADSPVPSTDFGVTDNGAVAHLKLRIDTRKWVAAKLKPNTYGDRVDVSGTLKGEVTVTVKDFTGRDRDV